MAWDVEYTDEFGEWWEALSGSEQESVTATVQLLEEFGPYLRFPHRSGVNGSRYDHIRELRVQHSGRQFRVLYAFDPRRTAILLIGGDKTGDKRWYITYIPIADQLYNDHLMQLQDEGLLDG
jgi:hypothetical protein